MAEELEKKSKTPKKHTKKRLLSILIIILGILLIIRLCLPFIVMHYINKKLASLDGYYGHANDIDIALYRGAYVINDVYLKKVDKRTHDTTDFFSAPKVDFSVEWHAIFQKKVVAEVEFYQPVIKYTLDKTIGKNAEKDSTDLIQLVKDLVPIRINRFAVDNGQIHYVDNTKSPKVDVPMTAVNIEGTNLTNRSDPSVVLPATIKMNSKLYDGTFALNVKLDPLNKVPTFDMNATLGNTNMVYLNNFFRAYANFDLKKGTMSLYTEFAAKNNHFVGYVKPEMRDLDIVQLNKEEGNPLQIAWEALIGTTAEVFQNQEKDQLAAKIPVEGNFKKPNIGVIEAIFSMLGNAFVAALKPSLDNSININDVSTKPQEEKKNFIEKIFDKKDKKKKKKR